MRRASELTKASRLLTVAVIAGAIGIALAGCVSAPVDRPCGVLIDPLGDVKATTRTGNTRIDVHFERGVAAGCWARSAAKAS